MPRLDQSSVFSPTELSCLPKLGHLRPGTHFCPKEDYRDMLGWSILAPVGLACVRGLLASQYGTGQRDGR